MWRVFCFVIDTFRTAGGHAPTAFMAFFVYVWALWAFKALSARRYRPSADDPGSLRVSVLVPVYQEPEAVFRRSLASVRANRPTELVAVVDGGDPHLTRVAREYCDRVVRIPKSGKRAANPPRAQPSPGADQAARS